MVAHRLRVAARLLHQRQRLRQLCAGGGGAVALTLLSPLAVGLVLGGGGLLNAVPDQRVGLIARTLHDVGCLLGLFPRLRVQRLLALRLHAAVLVDGDLVAADGKA